MGRIGPGHRGLSSGPAIYVTLGTALLSLDILSHSCRSKQVVLLSVFHAVLVCEAVEPDAQMKLLELNFLMIQLIGLLWQIH